MTQHSSVSLQPNGPNSSGAGSSEKVSVAEVAFHPKDETVISVVGSGLLRLFRYQDGQLKPIATPKVDNKVPRRLFEFALNRFWGIKNVNINGIIQCRCFLVIHGRKHLNS